MTSIQICCCRRLMSILLDQDLKNPSDGSSTSWCQRLFFRPEACFIFVQLFVYRTGRMTRRMHQLSRQFPDSVLRGLFNR